MNFEDDLFGVFWYREIMLFPILCKYKMTHVKSARTVILTKVALNPLTEYLRELRVSFDKFKLKLVPIIKPGITKSRAKLLVCLKTYVEWHSLHLLQYFQDLG